MLASLGAAASPPKNHKRRITKGQEAAYFNNRSITGINDTVRVGAGLFRVHSTLVIKPDSGT